MTTQHTTSEQQRESHEDAVEIGGLEVTPAEGEQEKSHESEETLSPDEKSSD